MKKTICNNKIPVGVMYAPFCRTEYVDMSVWKNDIKNMSEMGYKCLHGFSEWWRVEKQKGVFDFTETDYLIELCVKYGITPIINVATQLAVGYYMPRWMQQEYTGEGLVNSTGHGNPFKKQFDEACLDDPWYQMYAERYLKALASHYAGDERIGGWVIWGEPVMARGNLPICYCRHTVAKFKIWLKEKYVTIDKLNKAWGTEGPSDYVDFEEICPPVDQRARSGCYASWRDWKNFMEFNFARHIKNADAIFKNCGATQPTIIEIDDYLGSISNSLNINVWEFADCADIIGVSHFDAPGRETEMKMVVANSAAKSKDKSLFVVEACGGPRYPNYDKRTPSDEEICAEAVQMIGSNAKGLMYWCYRPRLSDFESATYGMCRQDGKPLPRTKKAGKLAESYDKFADIYNADFKSDVAVLYSYNIRHLSGADELTSSYNHAVRGALGMMIDSRIVPQAISEDLICQGVLKNFKVLILPLTYMLDECVCEKIKEFVKNGGLLIADEYFAFKNGVGHCFFEQPGAGFSEVFGAERDDVVYMEHISRVPQNDYNFGVGSVLDIMTPTSAEIVCGNNDKPLVLKNKYGSGTAVYISWQMFKEYDEKGGVVNSRNLITKLLKEQGVTPFLNVSGEENTCRPDLCAHMLYGKNEKVVTFVNPGYDARTETITVPGTAEIECIYGATPENIRVENGNVTFTLNLGTFGFSVIKLI